MAETSGLHAQAKGWLRLGACIQAKGWLRLVACMHRLRGGWD